MLPHPSAELGVAEVPAGPRLGRGGVQPHPHAPAGQVASQCDATIFVLDVKTSRRRQVRQTLEALERAGANLVGVVVNRTASPRRSSYYYES